MRLFIHKFRLINVLNLDVAAGAAGMALWINKLFQQQAPIGYYYLLFSVVWTIYLLDHLYDSKKPEAISERRKFFKKFHQPFWWVLIINLVITLAIFIIEFNILLPLYALPAFGITGIYILANWLFQENKQKFYLKEILISIGYALGIMVIPLSLKKTFDSQVLIVTLLIILMALWNVLLIARFERNIDKKEGQTSMSQWAPSSTIRYVNYLLYLLFLVLGIIYAVMFKVNSKEIVIYSLIAVYMAFPLVAPGLFKRKERYHRYVDMVFLLSFLCLMPALN